MIENKPRRAVTFAGNAFPGKDRTDRPTFTNTTFYAPLTFGPCPPEFMEETDGKRPFPTNTVLYAAAASERVDGELEPPFVSSREGQTPPEELRRNAFVWDYAMYPFTPEQVADNKRRAKSRDEKYGIHTDDSHNFGLIIVGPDGYAETWGYRSWKTAVIAATVAAQYRDVLIDPRQIVMTAQTWERAGPGHNGVSLIHLCSRLARTLLEAQLNTMPGNKPEAAGENKLAEVAGILALYHAFRRAWDYYPNEAAPRPRRTSEMEGLAEYLSSLQTIQTPGIAIVQTKIDKITDFIQKLDPLPQMNRVMEWGPRSYFATFEDMQNAQRAMASALGGFTKEIQEQYTELLQENATSSSSFPFPWILKYMPLNLTADDMRMILEGKQTEAEENKLLTDRELVTLTAMLTGLRFRGDSVSRRTYDELVSVARASLAPEQCKTVEDYIDCLDRSEEK